MQNNTLFYIIAAYMLVMSIVLFALMGVDKRRAQSDRWRIRESTLFLIALLGGALGGVVGMRVFRHKTKHTAFIIGMPLLLVANLAAFFAALYYLA